MSKNATPQNYKAMFEQHAFGPSILDDLISNFYDISSYTVGDSYHTAYLEGQRSVVRYILKQMIEGERPPQPVLQKE